MDFVCDVAVVAGTAVGVGLISGKETQIFVGNALNLVIFAVAFCVIFTVFREFCRVNKCSCLADVTQSCFKRGAAVFNFALTLSSFVCVTCCLAGVEQCLSDMLYLSRLPLYAIAVATLAAVVLLKGMSALKACNVVSVVMAAVLIVLLFVNRNAANALTAKPKPYMPIFYALFTLTISISVVCRLGCATSKVQNAVRTVTAAVVICAMLVATTLLADFSAPLPTLTGITSKPLKVYAVITVAISAVSSMVGCAVPIVEQIDSVVQDKTVSCVCVFGCAVTFSMFGFDFVVKYGYVFIALVGALMLLSMLFKKKSLPLITQRGR